MVFTETLLLYFNYETIISQLQDPDLMIKNFYEVASIYFYYFITLTQTPGILWTHRHTVKKKCARLHIWQTKWSLHLPPAAVNIFYKCGFLISRLQHTLTIMRIIFPALIPASDLLTQGFIHISMKPPNEHLSGVLGRKLTILDNFGPQHQTLQ